jgi:hypothetical protein
MEADGPVHVPFSFAPQHLSFGWREFNLARSAQLVRILSEAQMPAL